MSQDRRMTGGEVDRMLRVAQESAQAQQREQQDLIARVQRAMQDPYVTEFFKVAGVAIGVEGNQRQLIVATPDGRRREFALTPQIEKVLLQGLAAPIEEKAA